MAIFSLCSQAAEGMREPSVVSSWKDMNQGFPGGPVVKNAPCNARDTGSIPGLGTKIPHVAEQLSPCTTATEQAL